MFEEITVGIPENVKLRNNPPVKKSTGTRAKNKTRSQIVSA